MFKKTLTTKLYWVCFIYFLFFVCFDKNVYPSTHVSSPNVVWQSVRKMSVIAGLLVFAFRLVGETILNWLAKESRKTVIVAVQVLCFRRSLKTKYWYRNACVTTEVPGGLDVTSACPWWLRGGIKLYEKINRKIEKCSRLILDHELVQRSAGTRHVTVL